MSASRRLARNALANLARGGATALTVLLLPPILVRHMAADSYAVWVLVLQITGYLSFLDLGLQTAVGRYVAYADEKNDAGQRDSVFSTAVAALAFAGLCSLALLPVLAGAAPLLCPGLPASLLTEMRWALLIVGGSLAIGLPSSAWSGVFVGLQRYEIPAVAVGGSRILAAAGLVTAALAGQPLRTLAIVVAACNLLSYAVLYAFLRRLAPGIHFQRGQVSRATARLLASYCFTLTVLLLATLLVTGFDLILVARFDFVAVSAYSVAASPVVFLSGLLYAGLGVLTPHAATLHARNDVRGLGELTVIATRMSVLLLLWSGLPLLIYSAPVLRLWVGREFVGPGRPILIVLVIANLVRLIGAAYATIVIATGQQRFIYVSPLAEGIGNLGASLLLGFRYGAIGVALGTLFGAGIGLAAHLLYSMPRTRPVLDFERSRYLLSGVILPALATAPLIVVALQSLRGVAVSPVGFTVAVALSLGGARLLVGRWKTLATRCAPDWTVPVAPDFPSVPAGPSMARRSEREVGGEIVRGKLALRLLILVVVYQRRCSASETLRSLAACADALNHSLVVIWDNSPEAAAEEERAWLVRCLPRVEYFHDEKNPGLAWVYNQIIQRYLKAERSERFEYLLLFDHDSQVDETFFPALDQARLEYPENQLFLPLVRAQGQIVSPSDLYGCKGFRWKKARRGRMPSRHHNAVNSGMVIAVAYLQEKFPGYDERLRFYGTDGFFMREYGRRNSHFVVLDCTLHHDLSFFAAESLETKLWRHRETVAALCLLNEGRGPLNWFTRAYCGLCNVRQALKYRDLRFLA